MTTTNMMASKMMPNSGRGLLVTAMEKYLWFILEFNLTATFLCGKCSG